MCAPSSHLFVRTCSVQVMPKGKGLLSQGMAFSTSLFTDVAGVAMQGVRQVGLSCASRGLWLLLPPPSFFFMSRVFMLRGHDWNWDIASFFTGVITCTTVYLAAFANSINGKRVPLYPWEGRLSVRVSSGRQGLGRPI